jgi:hypothetical protein
LIILVSTHTGKEYEINVETYDPIKINEDLNNPEVNTIVIGDVIIARIDVKSICKKTEI